MKIVMTILVQNEDDIIEDNLRYHLDKGVDFFIITDHHSSDKTNEILRKYEKKGLAKVRVEETKEHYQAKWVTKMAQEAFKSYGADWVINNDADEFWVPETGTLKDFFRSIDPNIYKIHAKRYDFYYREHKRTPYYDSMIFRESIGLWTKCCHKGMPDIQVDVGNHDAYSEISNKEKLGTITLNDRIRIYHFPIRDIDRYKRKMISGTESILRTPGIPAEMFFHWRKAYYAIQNNYFEEYIKEAIKDKDLINDGIHKFLIEMDDTLSKHFDNKLS